MPLKIIYGSEQLPLKLGSVAIQCYLLEGQQPIIVKKSIQKALGYDGKSEDWLIDLLGSINKFYPIEGSVFEAYENPVRFESRSPDGETVLLKGISPEMFRLTCQTILNAKNDGYLSVQQLKHARAASQLLGAIGDSDLGALVETATGFTFLKETGKDFVREYLVKHTGDPLWQWSSAMGDGFFELLFGLYGFEWNELRTNPKKAGIALHEMVFSRLGPELREALRAQKPKRSYRKKNQIASHKLPPALDLYLSEVTSLYKAAAQNKTIFMQLLNRLHPQNQADIALAPTVDDLLGPVVLSDWEQTLKKGLSVNQVYHKKK